MEVFMVFGRKESSESLYSFASEEKAMILNDSGGAELPTYGNKPNIDELFGMLSDGKLSSERFIMQRKAEALLE